jgi:predicted nucleotidyltransferase
VIYEEIAKLMVKFSTKRFGIACIILMGSLSKKTIRSDIVEAPSDIDLIFVAKKESDVKILKDALIDYVNSEISGKYVTVTLHVGEIKVIG